MIARLLHLTVKPEPLAACEHDHPPALETAQHEAARGVRPNRRPRWPIARLKDFNVANRFPLAVDHMPPDRSERARPEHGSVTGSAVTVNTSDMIGSLPGSRITTRYAEPTMRFAGVWNVPSGPVRSGPVLNPTRLG